MLCCDDVEAVDLLVCCPPPESADRLVPVVEVTADVGPADAEAEALGCWLSLELDSKQLKQPIVEGIEEGKKQQLAVHEKNERIENKKGKNKEPDANKWINRRSQKKDPQEAEKLERR